MLSFEERELARQFHELGTRIFVPPTPRRTTQRLSVFALCAVLVVIAIAVLVVIAGDGSNSAKPSSPTPARQPSSSAGVTASATPSHRATPFGQIPPQILSSASTTYTVTGTITELGPDGQQHPVDGAHIDVFVNTSNGTGYHWMTDVTDATGRYELWGIPPLAKITLFAYELNATHTVTTLQPCAHQEQVLADDSLDIEIVLQSAGAAAAAAVAARGLPTSRANPEISGQAFERTPDGTRVAVPGAMVYVGGDMEPITATTITDNNGNYAICGIRDVRHEFSASAPGFSAAKPITSADVNGIIVDFELSR